MERTSAVVMLSVFLLGLGSGRATEAGRKAVGSGVYVPGKVAEADQTMLEFPLNLEYLEAEFFLWGALGYGLDQVAPQLPQNGPPPKGAQKARLDTTVRRIILEFAYQEVGHLRAIKSTVPGFPRPQLDLRAENFANIMNAALNTTLRPPFNPYASSVNYLLASYLVPYVGLTGYVGANKELQTPSARRLLAGLLAVESGQDAVIRALLYERMNEFVEGYPFTVAEVTDRLSNLRNSLGATLGDGDTDVDEGLLVPLAKGAEGKTTSNVLSADRNSVGFSRTPEEILRIVYSSGNASVPGGFFPSGCRGRIASGFL